MIYPALYKPILFVGCERLPFVAATTICGVLMMAYQQVWMFITAFMLYLVFVGLIRRVNKQDPQYFRCIYRYIRDSQDYYPSSAFYPGRADSKSFFG